MLGSRPGHAPYRSGQTAAKQRPTRITCVQQGPGGKGEELGCPTYRLVGLGVALHFGELQQPPTRGAGVLAVFGNHFLPLRQHLRAVPHHGAKNLWMSSISGARVPRHNAARGTRKTVHVQQRRTHLTNAWWFCPTTASNCSAPLIFTEAGAGWSFSHLIWEHPMRGLWLATRHHHEGLLAAVILI